MHFMDRLEIEAYNMYANITHETADNCVKQSQYGEKVQSTINGHFSFFHQVRVENGPRYHH